MNKENLGIVYVLTHPNMPGIVKIGMSERSDINKRLSELYNTSVPLPFNCEYACYVNKEDCRKLESAMHEAFRPQRINMNREFFKIEPSQAIAILNLFNLVDATAEVSKELDNDLTADDRYAMEKTFKKRPMLNYFELGLHKGDVLVSKYDENIKCTVYDAKHVEYEGEVYTLTSLTKKLLNIPTVIRATCYWRYNGRNLTEIYDDKYPIED